ncbi:hypothetical protein AB6A23_13345 [Paenibacillus tarimensis]
MATGRFFNKNDSNLWGTSIFKQWGETMGKMHQLSKSYICLETGKRDEWRKSEIENPHLEQGKFLDDRWIKQIPMFMDYRNVCSFFWCSAVGMEMRPSLMTFSEMQ